MLRSLEQRAEFRENNPEVLLIRQLTRPDIKRVRQIIQTGITIKQDQTDGGDEIITLSYRTVNGSIYLSFGLPSDQNYPTRCHLTEAEHIQDLTYGAAIIKDGAVIFIKGWPDRRHPRVTNADLITFSTEGISFETVFAPRENTLIGRAVRFINQNRYPPKRMMSK